MLNDDHIGEAKDTAFFAKKICLGDESLKYTPAGFVVRASDLHSVNTVARFVESAKSKIRDRKSHEIEEIENHRREVLANAEREGLAHFLSEVSRLQDEKKRYFDLLEEHCTKIVSHAMMSLLDDIDEQEKILAAVKQAAHAVRNDAKVTLEINPDHADIVNDIAQERGWTVDAKSSMAKGQCRFDVGLGKYETSFCACIESLQKAVSGAS